MHCVNSYSDEVTFYEGETRVISNGTSLRLQFDYNFTEGSQAGLNYTEDGILFSNNGTRLIWYKKMTMPIGYKHKKPQRRDYGDDDDYSYEDDMIRYMNSQPPLGLNVKRFPTQEEADAFNRQQGYYNQQPLQQRQRQQQKIRMSDDSWFYYSSSTYVMPVEDTGSSDNTSNNSNDTTTEVYTVEGDYEF
jgi:hypothetical protein